PHFDSDIRLRSVAATPAPIRSPSGFFKNPLPTWPGLSGLARAPVAGYATHYGASYTGESLACGGLYAPADPTILAVGPAHYGDWGCGATLRVCGVAGCLTGTRQDSCPGCVFNVLDLSEAGIALVCGPGTGACSVMIELMGDAPDPAGKPDSSPSLP